MEVGGAMQAAVDGVASPAPQEARGAVRQTMAAGMMTEAVTEAVTTTEFIVPDGAAVALRLRGRLLPDQTVIRTIVSQSVMIGAFGCIVAAVMTEGATGWRMTETVR